MQMARAPRIELGKKSNWQSIQPHQALQTLAVCVACRKCSNDPPRDRCGEPQCLAGLTGGICPAEAAQL